jgi:uncharacterized Zn finger protein (UPF0148 family)
LILQYYFAVILHHLLFIGWTLLADICPKDVCRGTPLMRLNGGNVMECVSCECKYEVSNSGDLIEQYSNSSTGNEDDSKMKVKVDSSSSTNNNKSSSGSSNIDANGGSAGDSSSSSSSSLFLNKASNEISKKLMLGWSLLSEVCTKTCHGDVPLMKDLAGNVSNTIAFKFLSYTYFNILMTCLIWYYFIGCLR